MPYADLGGFDSDRRLGAVPGLFTVALLTQYVTWKLGPGAGAGPGGAAVVPVPPVQAASQTR